MEVGPPWQGVGRRMNMTLSVVLFIHNTEKGTKIKAPLVLITISSSSHSFLLLSSPFFSFPFIFSPFKQHIKPYLSFRPHRKQPTCPLLDNMWLVIN